MSDADYGAGMPVFEDGGDPDFGLEEVQIRAMEAAEMEHLLISFEPEPPICDNLVPDSDEEDEDELDRSVSFRADGNEIEMFVGQIYCDKEAFVQTVLDHALNNGRNIHQYRYDRRKIGYCCVGSNCEWRVYAAKLADSNQWELRVYNNVHSCVPNGECDLMKVPVIVTMFRDKIREDPEYYMPMKIEEIIMEKWKIKVSRGQCQVARKKALKWIEREYEFQFQRLRDYAAEILVTNPGSTALVETLRSSEGLNHFNRCYVCFDALKKSWKETCRQVIGLDGCHLKGSMKGQLLVAIGRDGDNSIYPIAWCTPYAQGELAKDYPKTEACRVYSSTNHMYSVLEGGCSFSVCLRLKTCSCRKWEIRGIPCEHGYAVILHKSYEVEDFVEQWFRTPTWRRTYTDGLVPTRGAPFWPTGESELVHKAPSPPQPGRPKKSKKKDKRKKGRNESPTKKAQLKKRVMHCGVCGAPNHNSRFHSKKEGESSQVVPSQSEASEHEASQRAIVVVP